MLVVDDEPGVAEAYALWLREEYDVQTATDGEEAVEMVSEETDVVLLDRRMPNVSGDEALETIRERGYDVRVAMVTAVDPDFDILEMPFDGYLTKPVTREELVETVEELLALSQYDETVRELFSIAEKQAALEVEKSTDELAANEEYRELQARLAELREETEETIEEMDQETFKSAMADLDDVEPTLDHGESTLDCGEPSIDDGSSSAF